MGPKYKPSPDTLIRLKSTFTFHPVHGDQAQRYEAIRAEALRFGVMLSGTCPESRELTVAIRKLQEAVMYANASIAINEKPDENSLPD
jgi:hypothetical protein